MDGKRVMQDCHELKAKGISTLFEWIPISLTQWQRMQLFQEGSTERKVGLVFCNILFSDW